MAAQTQNGNQSEMKNRLILSLALMLICALIAGFFGPWWAPAAAILIIAALMKLPEVKAVILGAIVLGIIYLGIAIWQSSLDQTGIIAKAGSLLGGLSHGAMVALTAFIGLITGALAGWTGSVINHVIKTQ